MPDALPPDALRAGYDRSASSYDARFAALQRPKHDAVLARVPVAPGERVLDLGCGTGLLAARLTHARVIGVDLSRGMLDEARRRAATTATFVEGESRALPFRDESFDVAFAVTSLLVGERDLVAALLELRRVLRLGGRGALTFLSGEAPREIAPTLAACGLEAASERFECGQDSGWVVRRAR